MIHPHHGYEYRFFIQGSECSLAQFVRVGGYDVEVFFETVRSIGVDECNAILQQEAGLRQIAPLKSADNRTAAKGVCEFSIQTRKQLLIRWLRQIREIDFNPCLFE